MDTKLKNPTLLSKDLICFSNVRWNLVYKRPQHLLSRFSRYMRVFFIEEAVTGASKDHYKIEQHAANVWCITPHVQHTIETNAHHQLLEKILAYTITHFDIQNYITWYCTPMAYSFTRNLNPALTVYDCTNELAAFESPLKELMRLEDELFDKADIVFIGGNSLYEIKKNKHHNIYAFPSSIDKKHFMQARKLRKQTQKTDKINIGFYGTVDERLDVKLLENIARLKPEWNFIIIGPIINISPDTLPKLDNIQYLGARPYQELPKYIATWNIAMMPFVLNQSTNYSSPAKIPEYLAAGLPVISTAVRDVVDPYGANGFAYIIETPEEFVKAVAHHLNSPRYKDWLKDVDNFLSPLSWDDTWRKMASIIKDTQLHKLNAKAKLYI